MENNNTDRNKGSELSDTDIARLASSLTRKFGLKIAMTLLAGLSALIAWGWSELQNVAADAARKELVKQMLEWDFTTIDVNWEVLVPRNDTQDIGGWKKSRFPAEADKGLFEGVFHSLHSTIGWRAGWCSVHFSGTAKAPRGLLINGCAFHIGFLDDNGTQIETDAGAEQTIFLPISGIAEDPDDDKNDIVTITGDALVKLPETRDMKSRIRYHTWQYKPHIKGGKIAIRGKLAILPCWGSHRPATSR